MAISSLALTICSNRFVPSKFLFSVRCRYIVDAMISCMSSCRTLCACSHLVKLVCEIVFAWKNARKRWRAFFSLLPILTWVCIAARALTLSIFQRHEPRICVFANISPVSPCYCHFNLFIHRISFTATVCIACWNNHCTASTTRIGWWATISFQVELI